MKSIFRVIRGMVLQLKAEEVFVALRRWSTISRRLIPVHLRSKFPSIGKFIPSSSQYQKGDRYPLTREGTHYQIDRSDYVQWRLFYGVRDNALKTAKKYIRKGSVVLDIGANCGGFSLRLATHAARQGIGITIHAFEPNPLIFNSYSNNLKLNPSIEGMVKVYPFGLGRETGEKTFRVPDENTGAGRILETADSQYRIPVRKLDDFIHDLPPQPISFVKMIVEGFEVEVFKGGWETFKKFRPPVFFEVTPAWYEEHHSTLEEILEPLRSLGYSFSAEFQNEIIPYDPKKFNPLYQFNMLAEVK